MKIRPTGHYVLVKPEKAIEKDEMLKKAAAIGLKLDDKNLKREQAAMTTGVIVAYGPQAWKAYGPDGNGPNWAEVGNRVYFKRHVSDMLKDESDIDEFGEPQEYFLMVDENVIAVIEE